MERYVPWSICNFIVQRSDAEFRLDMSQREAKGFVQYLGGWTACKTAVSPSKREENSAKKEYG
jgi:hypothetical protein